MFYRYNNDLNNDAKISETKYINTTESYTHDSSQYNINSKISEDFDLYCYDEDYYATIRYYFFNFKTHKYSVYAHYLGFKRNKPQVRCPILNESFVGELKSGWKVGESTFELHSSNYIYVITDGTTRHFKYKTGSKDIQSLLEKLHKVKDFKYSAEFD